MHEVLFHGHSTLAHTYSMTSSVLHRLQQSAKISLRVVVVRRLDHSIDFHFKRVFG